MKWELAFEYFIRVIIIISTLFKNLQQSVIDDQNWNKSDKLAYK